MIVSTDTDSSLLVALRDIDQRFGLSLASAAQSGRDDPAARKCIARISSLQSHGQAHLDACLERFSKAFGRDTEMLNGMLLAFNSRLRSAPVQKNSAETSTQFASGQLISSNQAPAVPYSARGVPPPPPNADQPLPNLITSFESQASTIVASPDESVTLPHDRSKASFPSMSTITPATSIAVKFSDAASVRNTPPTNNFRIKNIPKSGFFCSDLPDRFDSLPFRWRYELQRLSTNYNIDLSEVRSSGLPEDFEGYRREMQRLTSGLHGKEVPMMSAKVWSLSENEPWAAELVMSASIEAQVSGNSMFKIKINPLLENPKSNRMLRKFGADRLMKIMVPSTAEIKTAARQLQMGAHSAKDITERLQQCLDQGGFLFRCRWFFIFGEPATHTKKQEKKNKVKALSEDEEGAGSQLSRNGDSRHEITFFAKSGPGLETLDRASVLNFMLPVDLNKSMSTCKADSRKKLSFSATYPTIVFNPAQIIEEDDIYSGEPGEDTSLDDPKFKAEWSKVRETDVGRRVMTDGCGRMSYAAAEKVWNFLGNSTTVPSAFQGRIGPCKGVWHVESVPKTALYDRKDVWIVCVSSQRKFQRHEEDYGENYDKHRMTFEVTDWSRKMPNAKLHRDFLPILEDRGVSRDTLKRFIVKDLEEHSRQAEIPWTEPELGAFHWLGENMPTDSDRNKGYAWSGSGSMSNAQKARDLAAVGFTATSSFYMSEIMKRLVRQHLLEKSLEIRINMRNSTSAIGIPDPFGCLGPDEIFLNVSDPDLFGKAGPLTQTDVLVARHPALSPCDIQRVHTVFKDELSHLVDVVVFPTRGSYPLASKLQGGDYDGDIFQIFGDQMLVQPFKNAPPAAQPPQPEQYRIKQDTTTLEELFEEPDPVDKFHTRCLSLIWEEQMLGQITNIYEMLRYYIGQGAMWDDRVRFFANLHHLVIDARKNGYTLTHEVLNDHRTTHLKDRGIPHLQQPLYKSPEKVKDDDPRIATGAWKSVVDFVLFSVARPKVNSIIEEREKRFSHEISHHDGEVETQYDRACEKYNDDEFVSSVLKSLEREIKSAPPKLYQYFCIAASSNSDENRSFDMSMTDPDAKQRGLWNKFDRESLGWYQRVGAGVKHDKRLRMWLDRDGKNGYTKWDLIKASALNKYWPHSAKLILGMAGGEICHLKANAQPKTVAIRREIFSNMKVKKRKREEVAEGVSFEATSFEGALFLTDATESFDSRLAHGNEPATKSPRLMLAKEAAQSFRSHRPSPLSRSFVPSRPASATSMDSDTAATLVAVDDQPPDEVATEVDTDDEMSNASETDYQTANEDAVMRNTVHKLSQGYSQLSISDDAHQ